MNVQNVAELRDMVEGRGLQFSDGAFTFADRDGCILQLESAAGRSVWRDLSGVPISVHANHLLASSLQPLEDPAGGWGETFMGDSRSRQQRLEELLGVGGAGAGAGKDKEVNVETLQAVLADRGTCTPANSLFRWFPDSPTTNDAVHCGGSDFRNCSLRPQVAGSLCVHTQARPRFGPPQPTSST